MIKVQHAAAGGGINLLKARQSTKQMWLQKKDEKLKFQFVMQSLTRKQSTVNSQGSLINVPSGNFTCLSTQREKSREKGLASQKGQRQNPILSLKSQKPQILYDVSPRNMKLMNIHEEAFQHQPKAPKQPERDPNELSKDLNGLQLPIESFYSNLV